MLSPLAPTVLLVTVPTTPAEHDPSHTALAFLLVGTVVAAGVVTETVRHLGRRRVHYPVPIPPRHPGPGSVPFERKHREPINPPVLLVHRP